MKLFGNKFFILFLILIVGLFSFSARVAHAGGVISGIFNAVASVFSTIINVVNVVVNTIVGNIEIVLGNITGINFLSEDGNCRLENTNQTFVAIYSGECDVSSSGSITLIPPAGIGCAFSYQPKFYIPNKDISFKQSTYELGGFWGGLPFCEQITISENNNNVALYRFVRPSSISQSELSDWYFNIKNNIGNGFLIGQWSLLFGKSLYYVATTDTTPLSTFLYSAGCAGNVCDKITDYSIPPDSYVIYAAKMLGDYTGVSISGDLSVGLSCNVFPGLNKFLNIDNDSKVTFPDPSTTLGNAFIGPIKTGSCPLLATSTYVIDPPFATKQVGQTQQFIGRYDPDGPSGPQAQQNLTNLTTWSFPNASVATINSSGLATCSAAGSAVITSVYSGITATASLTCSSVIIPSIISPSSSATTTLPGGRREMPPQ